MVKNTFTRGIVLGIIGGSVGMIAMDLVMVAEFLIKGLPIYTYLELIGSVLGGGVALGAILHLLVGSLLGLIFSAVVLKVDALRINTVRKGVGLGFLAT